MKIDLEIILKNFDGTDIVENEKPFTIRIALMSSFMYEDNEFRPTQDEKMRVYKLGHDLAMEKTIELKSEDIVFVKPRLNRCYKALIYGQVTEILEGTTEESKK